MEEKTSLCYISVPLQCLILYYCYVNLHTQLHTVHGGALSLQGSWQGQRCSAVPPGPRRVPGCVSRARWRAPASPAGARSPGRALLSPAAPPGISGAWPTCPVAARALWPRCRWSWGVCRRGTERASKGRPHPPRKCHHHLREEESNARVRGDRSSSHHSTGQAWLQ